jgi:hypothetical protein
VLRCRRKAGCWPVRVPFLAAFSRQLRGCWGSTDEIKADDCDVFHRWRTYSVAKARKHWALDPEVGVRTLMASRGAGGWRAVCNWRAGRCRRATLGGSGAPTGFGGGALSGRIWRELQIGGAGCPRFWGRRSAAAARSWRDRPSCFRGGSPKWRRGGRDTGAVWRGCDFGESRRRSFQKTATTGGTS